MKKLIHLFLFLFFFQAEIKVRASGGVLQNPQYCMQSKDSCAIHVVGPALHYLKNDVKLSASSGATLVRHSAKSWSFVTGAIWIEKGLGLEVKSVYANFKAESGQYWIIGQSDRVLIRNMSAVLRITLRDGSALELPEGFEVWISGLNSKGKSEYGVIRPIDMKSHIPLWGNLYGGSKKSFENELMIVKSRWGDLPERSGQIYRVLADRRLASDQESLLAREVEQARKREAQRKLKNIFFERVFER
jgi:hypothetical protein